MAAIKQEVNVPLVVTIGIVSGILLLVVVIGVQAWYQSEEQSETVQKESEFPNVTLEDLQNGQKANIGSYRWVDKKNSVVTIPISQAMNIMVEDQGNFPSTQPSAGDNRP